MVEQVGFTAHCYKGECQQCCLSKKMFKGYTIKLAYVRQLQGGLKEAGFYSGLDACQKIGVIL